MSRGADRGGRGPVLLDWQVGSATGWGVFGLNLALELVRSGRGKPVPLVAPARAVPGSLQAPLLAELEAAHRAFLPLLARARGTVAVRSPVFRALGNGLAPNPHAPPLGASRTIGLVFFEDTSFGPEALAHAAHYDLLIAGSTWNAELLRRAGLAHVDFCMQGVDPSLFHPAPRAGWFGDRFVVFSGGKLEYRKGQDIVVAAFREFRKRHPDALLIVAWHNFWPSTAAEIAHAGLVEGVPEPGPDGALDLGAWLERNGLPASSVFDAGLVAQVGAAQLIREADVAVFPNRAEGGTNLVAMECMASGVPTVLSANTGHLDLVDPARCYPLERQDPVEPTLRFQGTEGWGGSSVDELVDALERVRAEREEARRRGRAAARFMRRHSWRRQIQHLFELALPPA